MSAKAIFYFASVPILLAVFWHLLVANEKGDFICMARHCAKESSTCILNSQCREGLACFGKCGNNMTCTYMCLATYGDSDQLMNFLDCTISNYHCINPGAEQEDEEYNKPDVCALTPKNFNYTKLLGKWYITYGLNPIYDCFDRSYSTVTENPDGKSMLLTEYYDVPTFDNGLKQMISKSHIGIKNKKYPNILYLRSIDPGFFRDDEFWVVDTDNGQTYVVMYYYGICSSIRYEGAFVYSRTPVMSEKALSKSKDAVAKHGWEWNKFCKPATT